METNLGIILRIIQNIVATYPKQMRDYFYNSVTSVDGATYALHVNSNFMQTAVKTVAGGAVIGAKSAYNTVTGWFE